MMKFKGDGPRNRPQALRVAASSPQTGRSQPVTAYSIMLSTLRTSDCGIVMPIVLAGLRLTNSFILVCSSTEKLAGFALLNILSASLAARRDRR
jgi:hypothetical protein